MLWNEFKRVARWVLHVGVETDGSQVKRALSLPTSLLGELNLSKIQAAHNFSCCSSGRAVSVPLAWNYSFLGNYSLGEKKKYSSECSEFINRGKCQNSDTCICSRLSGVMFMCCCNKGCEKSPFAYIPGQFHSKTEIWPNGDRIPDFPKWNKRRGIGNP